MDFEEYSSPGQEHSLPGTELAPTGQAITPGAGEYFPEAPELAKAPEDTRVSPPMPSGHRRRRAGRGVLRQAAAAVAIGAVTVTAVAAVSGSAPQREPSAQYICTDFTQEQREYLDRLYAGMEDGDADEVERLIWDGGDMFLDIYDDVIIPFADQIAGRQFNGVESMTFDFGALVGYDGQVLFSLPETPHPGSFLMLTASGGGSSVRDRQLCFDGEDTYALCSLSSLGTSIHFRLERHDTSRAPMPEDGSMTDGLLLERRYDADSGQCREAVLSGHFEPVRRDGERVVMTLSQGSADFSAGPYAGGTEREFTVTGRVDVEDFQSVRFTGAVSFRPRVNRQDMYFDVALTDSQGREYVIDTYIAPLANTPETSLMLISGAIENQFGYVLYRPGVSDAEPGDGDTGTEPDTGDTGETGNEPDTGETLSGLAGDNITWTLTPDNVLTLTGTGDMYDYGNGEYNTQPPWKAHICGRETTTIVLSEGITHLGDNAFRQMDLVTSIDIPDSVRSIGDCCFYYCEKLSDVALPDGLASIGLSAFALCPEIRGITIPDSVTEEGSIILSGCTGLTDAYLSGGIISLKTGTFKNCTSLQHVTLGEGIENFGSCIFQNCASLTRVDFPESTKSLGMEVFWDCTSLTDVYIPAGIEREIPDNIFEGCDALADVWFGGTAEQWAAIGPELPSSVTVHYGASPSN